MKKIIYLFAVLTILAACKNEVRTPKAIVELSKTEVGVNEVFNFTFTGVADQVVVYTGDDGHEYEKRNSDSIKNADNVGVVLPKKMGSHSYIAPGVYQMVFVASCYGDLATDLKRDTCSVKITVTDDNTTIKDVYATAYSNELHAKKEGSDWLIVSAREVFMDTKFFDIKDKTKMKMLMTIKAGSANTNVKVNGEAYDKATKYDFTNPLALEIVAQSGASTKYNLYFIFKPEFDAFSINGVKDVRKSIDKRDKFSYVPTIEIVLPKGTAVNALKPEFTIFEGQKVTLNGSEFKSGDTADFTNPVTFHLTNTQTKDGKTFTAENDVMVTVTLAEE